MTQKKYSLEFAGRPLEVEFSNWAEQADGAAVVKYGGTVALVTSVMGKKDRVEIDYLPLTVEYEERYYAAGKIYGSRFIRRESRPTEVAVLTGRMVDRTIRPRFNPLMRRDIQVIVTILSMDAENDPDFPALLGASLALGSSSIPFQGPIAGVRVGIIDGRLVVNPSYAERGEAQLDLFVGGTGERINMVEAGGKDITEEKVLEAAQLGQSELSKLIEWQENILREINPEKEEVFLVEADPGVEKGIKPFTGGRLEEAVYEKDKAARQSKINLLKNEMFDQLRQANSSAEELRTADWLFEKAIDELVHKKIIEEEKRPDSRKLDEIRPLEIAVGVLPRTHGSAIFMRGNTHALSVITLGAPGDILLQQGMEVTGEKRFIHHYNFPPYSVGETGPMRGPGRREIGHGALAEKALVPLIPSKENFPYTIRIVSEILSSNGSSSMASVCGASLALMDAGVPIPTHAAGIAMGLMTRQDQYKILTDIQGPEDHHGDMDCKISGTKDGVTAMQMDVKIEGITTQILKEILDQAKKARLEILAAMNAVIAAPRPQLSPYAPRILTLQINPDRIRDVIGPGGKTINAIIAETGVSIDIEDSGLVFITAENEAAAQKAIERVKSLTRELKVGEILRGKVTRILDFGAIVEILPNQEGMVHISELAPWRVPSVESIVKLGDVIPVKIKEVSPDGKIRLSLKEAKAELGEAESPPEGAEPRRREPGLERRGRPFGSSTGRRRLRKL